MVSNRFWKGIIIPSLRRVREVLVMLKRIKDRLFPIFCVDCGEEGIFCCKDCLDKIKKNEIIEIDFILKKQERAIYLDNLIALFDYKKNQEVQELIHLFKYEYCEELGDLWQELYGSLLKFEFNYDFIIPVPLHAKRKRERGFNQSEILASSLWQEFKTRGFKINLDIVNLKRVRYTSQQIHLGGREREKNLKDAFKWAGDSLKGKSILLIDDVYTTGTTLNESARVLKNVGAVRVDCLVLAKD